MPSYLLAPHIGEIRFGDPDRLLDGLGGGRPLPLTLEHVNEIPQVRH
jgi:hypothetical protein